MMKSKILFLATLFVITLYNSCSEKNLDLQPYGATEGPFFLDDNGFNQAAIGLYSKSLFYYQIPREYVYARINLIADDDVTPQSPDNFDRWQLNPSLGPLGNAYRTTYELISRSNVLLDKLETEGDNIKNPNLKTFVRGEALFFRAYAHFLAWNWWETAPLITKRLTQLNELEAPNTSGTQLLDQAITDLQEAETLLPQKGSWGNAGVGSDGDNLGRLTVGAAKALLGKAYLYRANATKNATDYASAASKLAEVTGYSLVPDYGDNFRPTSENNSESVFEIQFGKTVAGDNGWLDTDAFNVIGTLSGYRNFARVGGNPSGAEYFFPSKTLQQAFDANDPRIPWTFFRVGDVIGNNDRTYQASEAAVSTTGAHMSKYLKEAGDLYNSYTNSSVDFNNERVIRYADVLLMRAEALLESGGAASEVIGLINQVRKRARESVSPASAEPADYATTESNAETIAEWIRKERRLELAFEGHRLFDLLRWHRAGKINLQTWDWGTPNAQVQWKPENIRFPFPQSELNANLQLRQNPGY